MRTPLRSRTGLVGSVCLLLAVAAAGSLAFPALEPPVGEGARPEDVDSLRRYLEPARPAPRLDDYAAFIPAAPPRVALLAPAPQQEALPTTTWELSAIMIAGSRPVAILNDETVAAGARLPDGTVVLEIEPDHVVIRAPNGALRRLVLSTG